MSLNVEYQDISVDVRDGVVTVTLARPDVMNALSTQMRAELIDIYRRHQELGARVYVLRGQGRAFCSGQDLSDRGTVDNMDLERTLRDEYIPMVRAITECPVPTLSAVNGPAAGAGANLALASDIVIAAQSAYFAQAFTRIGLATDAGGSYFLPRLIGMARAKGAAFFAENISAVQAENWGMIWEAVPDDEFDAVIERRAAHLANGPTEAYRAMKAMFEKTHDNTLEGQLIHEARLQGTLGLTRDFKEGVVAFLEKRPAKFEGR